VELGVGERGGGGCFEGLPAESLCSVSIEMSDDDDDIHEARLNKLTAGGNGGGPGGRRGYLSLIEQPPTPMTDLGRLRSVKVQEADEGAPSSPQLSGSDEKGSNRRRQTKEEALQSVGKVHDLLFAENIQKPRDMIEAVKAAVAMRPALISPMTSPAGLSTAADSGPGHAAEARMKIEEETPAGSARSSRTPRDDKSFGAHDSLAVASDIGVGEKRQRAGDSPCDRGMVGKSERRSTGEESRLCEQASDRNGDAHQPGNKKAGKDRGQAKERDAGVGGGAEPLGGRERAAGANSPLYSPPVNSKEGTRPGNAMISPSPNKVPPYPNRESPQQMGKVGSVLDEGKALKAEAELCKKKDPLRASRLYFKSSIKFLESASEEANTPPQRSSHVGFEQVSKMFHYTAMLTSNWLKKDGQSGNPDRVRAARETEAVSLKAAAMCLMRNYHVVSKKRLKDSIKDVTKDARDSGRFLGSADGHGGGFNPTPPDSATSDGGDGTHITSGSPGVGGNAKDQLVKDTQELMQCLDYWTLGCEKASSIRNSRLEPLQDIQMTQPARLVQYLKDFVEKCFDK
jgi:hypothetical protein